jgi:hypothetical protein
MARRDWVVAWAIGVGVGLLPGCDLLPIRPEPAPPAQYTTLPHPADKPLPPPAPPDSSTGLVEIGGETVAQETPVTPPAAPETPAPKEPPVKGASATVAVATAAKDEDPKEAEELPVVNVKPAEEPLLQALRCFLNKQPAEAVELLKNYDKDNQEALLALLPLAVRLTEADLKKVGPQELSATLEQLHSLTEPIARHAALRIDKLCFCREIRRFGVYDPLPDACPAFQAGCDGRRGELIRVYAEVRNFASKLQSPYYVTELASKVEIYLQGTKDKPIWQYDFSVQPERNADRSRTPRHDYFINYEFGVPSNLPPGHYTLWIQVEDRLSPRTARRSLDFEVVAGGTLHGQRPHDLTVREGSRD